MTAALAVDVTISAEAWYGMLPDPEAVVRAAADAVWRALDPDGGPVEISILLADDETVRALNKRHRAIDRPTNVLSFPIGGAVSGGALPAMLGDIVLASGVVAREAEEQGKTLAAHLSHLIVHGVLHLLGYDHASDPEADTMEDLEVRTLAALGLPNPYRYGEAAE